MSNLRYSLIIDLAGNLRQRAKAFSGDVREIAKTGERELGRVGRASAATGKAVGADFKGIGHAGTNMSRDLDQSLSASSASMRRYGRQISEVTEGGRRNFGTFHRSILSAGRGIDGALTTMGNRYMALASGATAAAAIRFVGNIEEAMVRLGIQAGKTDEEMADIKKKLFDQSFKWRVDVSGVQQGAEQIIDLVGDIKALDRNIGNVAIGMQATGADGVDMGQLISAIIMNFHQESEEAVRLALDKIVSQGKIGALPLRDQARFAGRVLASYAAGTKRTDQGGLAEAGALMQLGAQGTNSVELGSTATMSLIAELNDPQIQKKLRKRGVSVMDPDDPKRMRSVLEILKEIVTKADGSASKLGTIFGTESMKLINVMALEYATPETKGQFPSADAFLSAKADGTQIQLDAARAAKTFNAEMTGLVATFQGFADRQLAKPLGAVAEGVGSLDEGTRDGIMWGLIGGGALTAGYVGAKALGAGRLFKRRGKPGTGSAADMLGGLGGGMGVVPVSVVNWPGGPMSPLGGKNSSGVSPIPGPDGRPAQRTSGAAIAEAARKRGSRFRGMRGAGAMGAIGAAMYGVDALGAAIDGDAPRAIEAVGGGAGAWGGAVAGAAAGSLIGSVIPGVGTVIGGGVGGIIGTVAGSELGQALARLAVETWTDRQARAEPISGTVKIEVSGPARVTGLTKDSNTGVDFEVMNLGQMMAGGM